MDIVWGRAAYLRRITTHWRIEKLQWKWRYLRWRLAGTHSFSDEYVQQVSADIEAGQNHGTLSVVLDEPDLALREATFVAETMTELGLQPSNVCIEYGCGSLRIGEPIMRMLNPGNYIGLDVTDRFWKNGIERLGLDFIEQHRPRLNFIDSGTHRLSKINAKFVVCIAVFIHVPPPELDGFVGMLASVLGPDTTLLLDTRLGSRTTQIHYRTWQHSRTRAAALFAKHGLRTGTPATITRAGLPIELSVLVKQ